MKHLYRKYNHRETVLFVSLYPRRGELYSSGTSGVASYAKNVITHLSQPVVVLANREAGKKLYEEEHVLVSRVFQKGNYFLWLQVLKELLKFNNVKKIVIQFDFGMYGSLISTALILPFLLLIKLMGKEVFIISHHVITNVFNLKGHVGLGEGWGSRVKGNLYNFLFRSFYFMKSMLVKKIVVLEDPLKKMLAKYVPEHKIEVINHGVDTNLKPISKRKARELLNLKQDNFLIEFFGFVNWFKGADFFAQTFKNSKTLLNKNVSAVIAGGESPTMKSKKFYQNYFNNVTKIVSDSPVVNMTGYVAQKDLVKYFSAADLVIFPYRSFMTASGVMSLALSYGKPFVVSKELAKMFESTDFKKTLSEVGLKKSDITFSLNKRSCVTTAENVLRNGIKRKMAKLAGIERVKRDYRITAQAYEQLFEAKPLFVFGNRLGFNTK